MGSNMTKMVIGLVLIAVALIVFPIVLTGVNEILTWSEGGANVGTFTGLETLVKIAPLLLFIGFLTSGGILTFTGFREWKGTSGSRKKSRTKGGLH